MRTFNISKGVKGFVRLYDYALRFKYMITEKALHKAKVLSFWGKHGLKATIDAFDVSRSTLFLWKKKLNEGKGNLESLNDESRAPNNKRKREVDSRIEKFIINIRKEHYGLGKEKIKPFLKNYCQTNNLKYPSESTIGRIISDLKEKGLIVPNNKLSFQAKTGRFTENNPKRRKKLRRKDYKPKASGDLLQLDTVIKFINGIKRYTITAIDIKSDFAFAFSYPGASSKSTKDFFQKLQIVAPFEIKRVQTDNGSEFEKHFRDYVEKNNIIHFHNYPRCPKMNAYIERFNRTIQEEFINWNRSTMAYDLNEFNRKLMDWLLWYNTERPHCSLGQIPPMKYILNNLNLTPKKSNMLWTHTNP